MMIKQHLRHKVLRIKCILNRCGSQILWLEAGRMVVLRRHKLLELVDLLRILRG